MDFDAVVTSVKGDKIRFRDVIVHLKSKGIFRHAIYELIEQKVIDQALRENKLEVPVDEVERHARNTRVSLGIEDETTFARYLRFYGLTEEQWFAFIRQETARECLRQGLITPQRITEYFRREPLRFASVSIARIACRTREESDRVLEAARENKLDFVELARCFSCDESTRLSGGFIGNVKRGMLPPEVEQQVFSSAGNEVFGPYHENSLWTVYKVYSVNLPKLTDALKKVIRDQIFNEWLRQQVCTVPA